MGAWQEGEVLPGDSSWSPREVGGGEGALLGITWYLEQRWRGLGFESPQENVKESQRQIYPGVWWTLQ